MVKVFVMGEDARANKRRFSNISNSEKQDEINRIEHSADDIDRVVAVVSDWFKEFLDSGRPGQIRMPKPDSAGHLITQESYDLLIEWYGKSSELHFAVVDNCVPLPDPAEDKDRTVGSYLPDDADCDLWVGKIDQDFVRLWEFNNAVKRPIDPDTLVKDLDLQPGERVIVSKQSVVAGTVGLNNLGNTCYMNSALQCLVHIPEIVEYFVSGEYQKDINTNNPIGYGGTVAKAFANLISALYTEYDSAYRPSHFKMTMGRFNRSFAGYQQQDSQEFTAFLLDALHEDLNKVKNKPATEKPELDEDKVHDPEAIKALAEECWELHKKRNASTIMDLFTGVYKSTLVCPVCNKVSITFDPFGDLTLPFPSAAVWIHPVKAVMLDGSLLEFDVALSPLSTIRQLKEQAQKVVGKSCGFFATEIFSHKIYQEFADQDIVSDKISKGDVVVLYEVENNAESQSLVVQTCLDDSVTAMPFVLVVNHKDSNVQVKAKLTEAYSRLLENPEPFKLQKIARTSTDAHDYFVSYRTFIDLEAPITEAPEDDDQDMHDKEIDEQTLPTPSSEAYPDPDTESVPVTPDEQTTSLSDSPDTESFEMVEGPEQPSIGPYDILVGNFAEQPVFKDFKHCENPIAIAATEKLKKASHLTLDDLLDLFSTPEVLGENDLWYCSRCKEFRQATKQLELWRVPDLFTVHLKRFRDAHSYRDKITDVVDFPITGLDMTKKVLDPESKELIYDLVAVDNHYGGLGGGHYTAYAKNPITGKWHYYDDSRVSDADPKQSITGNAYLLFYRRRSPEPLGKLEGKFFEAVATARDEKRQAQRQEAQEEYDRLESKRKITAAKYLAEQSDAGSGHVLGTKSSPASLKEISPTPELNQDDDSPEPLDSPN